MMRTMRRSTMPALPIPRPFRPFSNPSPVQPPLPQMRCGAGRCARWWTGGARLQQRRSPQVDAMMGRGGDGGAASRLRAAQHTCAAAHRQLPRRQGCSTAPSVGASVGSGAAAACPRSSTRPAVGMLATWNIGNMKEESSRICINKELAFARTPVIYPQKAGCHSFSSMMANPIEMTKGMLATWNKGNMKEESSRICINKELAFAWTPMMYLQKAGYHSFSSIMTNPVEKRKGMLATWNIGNMKEESSRICINKELAFASTPMMYSQKSGYHRFSSMMTNPVEKRKVLAGARIPLMYQRAVLGYRRFSTSNSPIIKGQVKLFKENAEKLVLYTKTVSIPMLEKVRCFFFEAIRTVWLFVTSLVWEHFWHVKKGFEDQVSQYHLLAFMAVVSSLLIYLIEKFNLRSYFEFLFDDGKEDPIAILEKEMLDIKNKLNEQSQLAEEDRGALIAMASEVLALKVRADRFEVCMEELRNELMSLKEKEDN